MAARRKRPSKAGTEATADRIVDAAVDRAAAVGWQRVRMADLARQLNVPVAVVLRHYRDLDAVADAWFARATAAMADAGAAVSRRPPKERIEALMLAWFDALSAQRRVTADMLRGKLYLAHPHHWAPMIFSLSRTVQLLRDVAGLTAEGRRRQIEEAGLSALFLATIKVWCGDESKGQARTRAFLKRWLAAADRALARPASGKHAKG